MAFRLTIGSDDSNYQPFYLTDESERERLRLHALARAQVLSNALFSSQDQLRLLALHGLIPAALLEYRLLPVRVPVSVSTHVGARGPDVAAAGHLL